jgi:predicted Rdx family selenoprotein
MEVRIIPKTGGKWKIEIANEDLWHRNFKFLIVTKLWNKILQTILKYQKKNLYNHKDSPPCKR